MEALTVPRFVLSGVGAGVGKSVIAVGLAVALRKRNVSLSCCVVGSDLVEALILRRLTRRYVSLIDSRLLSNAQILSAVHRSSVGADLLMIEGSKGLYDGVSPGSLRCSDAEVAALSRTNVVLVVDATGLGNSLAALVSGFSSFAQGFSLAGVVVNRTKRVAGEERDKIYYDCALQSFGMPSLIGALPELDIAMPPHCDEFYHRRNRASLPLQFFVEMGNIVTQHIDIDELVRRAGQAPNVKLTDVEHRPAGRRCRIAVSEDNCFSLCYQDNLDQLRYFGAELVPFSPLADSSLPKKVGGVYLTGAALAEYGQELSNNKSMRQAIKSFAQSGGVLFSEGAGTAYLCDAFQYSDEGELADGVGLIPGRALWDERGHSFSEAVTVEDSVLGRAGLILKGLETGEWRLEESRKSVRTLRVSYSGGAPVEEGFSATAQAVSTFLFTHWGSNPQIARNLVDAAEIVCRL
ncbi:MAG: hypothetical protein J5J00_12805 [Deltaproteobacteria bacterium]|nr:hypothetical protein [Deltaproteobacteria bacterium]